MGDCVVSFEDGTDIRMHLILAFGGHGLYVRKTNIGEEVDGDPNCRSVNGIVIPPAMGNQTCWFEVLGCGPNVGKKCTASHARKWRMSIIERYKDASEGMMAAKHSNLDAEHLIGRLVYIPLPYPLVDERVCSACGLPDGHSFVEETLPIAIWD